MSLFDILTNTVVRQAARNFTGQALRSNSATSLFGGSKQSGSGNLGQLLAAGAIGAVLGGNSSFGKKAAMIGLGAVAWNFYQKWAKENAATPRSTRSFSNQEFAEREEEALPVKLDATSELAIRAMVYAARADGKIGADERNRMKALIAHMLPCPNVESLLAAFEREPIDFMKLINGKVRSKEMAGDVYRLSCLVIDIDTAAERNYLAALGGGLGLSASTMSAIEKEAEEAKRNFNPN